MRLVLSRQFSELLADRLQWNALASQSPASSVFQTYEWFECWWTAFGRGKQLYVVTAWEADALVGVAPLMLVRRTGLRQLEFVGTPNADYQDFILGRRATELLPLFAHHLFTQCHEWDVIVLRNLPTESATFAMLPRIIRSFGLGSTDHERVACPTLEVASRTTEVLRLLNSYNLRRRLKQMRSHGELSYARCSTPSEVEHHLPQFFAQYVKRHRGTRAARTFSRADVLSFYTALATSLLPRGWLHLSVLKCAGRPVAFHFGFEYDGRLYWYKPCFEPTLARLSPGTVLLSYLIRDSLQRHLKELDFTVGAEAFKYRYANTERTNANVRIFRRRWLYMVALAIAWVVRKSSRLRHVMRR